MDLESSIKSNKEPLKSLKRKFILIAILIIIIGYLSLLTFFWVISAVTKLEKVEVQIPESQYAKVPEDTKGRMMLSVDANNQIHVGTMPVTIEELKAQVTKELDENPELRILIRADQTVEYKTCKEIMIACGEVGATDLIYATFEE